MQPQGNDAMSARNTSHSHTTHNSNMRATTHWHADCDYYFMLKLPLLVSDYAHHVHLMMAHHAQTVCTYTF